jgi:hypothetical protein
MERVQLLMLSASPTPGSSDFGRYGGAVVNVYTTELSEIEALALAAREVAAAGWAVESVEEPHWLTRAELSETPMAWRTSSRRSKMGSCSCSTRTATSHPKAAPPTKRVAA